MIMRVIQFLTTLIIGSLFFSASAQAKQGVCVYKDSEYEGPRRCFENNIRSFGELGINDQISSFQIHGNVDIIFYEHKNFRGNSKRFSNDQSRLTNGMNDNFSSMKIVRSNRHAQWGDRGNWGYATSSSGNNDWDNDSEDNDLNYDEDEDINNLVCLYADKNFKGRRHCFKADNPRFENFNFDNQADSIYIRGDIEVELYQHAGYKGFSRVFTRSASHFKPHEHDQYSAIRIRKRRSNAGSVSNYDEDYDEDRIDGQACLFPKRNYGGQPYCFNSDNPRFADFNFDNKADSLRMNNNIEVILYQHENYRGYSRVFRHDVPRFNNQDRDQFSSIKIRRR